MYEENGEGSDLGLWGTMRIKRRRFKERRENQRREQMSNGERLQETKGKNKNIFWINVKKAIKETSRKTCITK